MAQDELDRRDGEALRLLREALPPEWGEPLIVLTWVHAHGCWSFGVQDASTPLTDAVRFHGDAPTVAEAADACRAALTEATR